MISENRVGNFRGPRGEAADAAPAAVGKRRPRNGFRHGGRNGRLQPISNNQRAATGSAEIPRHFPGIR